MIALTFSLVTGGMALRREYQNGIRAEALIHLEILGPALQRFSEKYGRYPDETTASLVKARTETPIDLGGSTSNRLFRQLLVDDLHNEKPFFAQFGGSCKQDDIFSLDDRALSPGECGFSYLTGEDSANWGPRAVLVVTPFLPSSTRFDPRPFGGKAVVLFKDNSTATLKIQRDGQVLSPLTGKSILNPLDPCWNGHPPVIHECEWWPPSLKK